MLLVPVAGLLLVPVAALWGTLDAESAERCMVDRRRLQLDLGKSPITAVDEFAARFIG